MSKLTEAQAKHKVKPGFYGDGRTLYLRVSPSGSKSWIQRVMVDRKRHDIGLGPYPEISLKEARKRAMQNRIDILNGKNPLAEKRKTQVPTFREAAQRTFDMHRPKWRNGKHTRSWLASMEKHAFPIFGDRKVNKIGREDVLEVLEPIWTSIPETARKLRQRIRATFKWCYSKGYVERNPAGEIIDGALPAMPSVKEHFRALPYKDVPAALDSVLDSNASTSAKLCFCFLVLTAARSIEAREAVWSEFDEDKLTWCIPAQRMKANEAHKVPLSGQALEVLKQAKTIRDESDLIFPSPLRPGKAMSDMTLTKVLRTVGLAEQATVHGFRSSFRDWAAECTDAPVPIMEMALAHRVGDAVMQAYFRSKLVDLRRELMQEWADHAMPNHDEGDRFNDQD